MRNSNEGTSMIPFPRTLGQQQTHSPDGVQSTESDQFFRFVWVSLQTPGDLQFLQLLTILNPFLEFLGVRCGSARTG